MNSFALKPGIFRLFLALVVLTVHSSRFDLADWAVYTFFVLSGYWIYRMWDERYSRAAAPYATFLRSRFWRLLPVFWITNAASAAVMAAIEPGSLHLRPFDGSLFHAAASNLAILGYATLGHAAGPLQPAWSLDIELQFYLIAPLAIIILRRRPLGWISEAGMAAVCLLAFVAVLARFPLIPRNFASYGIYFLIGLLAAHRGVRISKAVELASLLLVLGSVAVCASSPALRPWIENAKHGATAGEIHAKQVFQALLAVASAPLALATVRRPSGTRDRLIGELTYVIYLVQWPVLTLHGSLYGALSPMRRIPSLAAAWIAVAVLSLAVFRYVDRPLEERRKRFVRRREPKFPPAASSLRPGPSGEGRPG